MTIRKAPRPVKGPTAPGAATAVLPALVEDLSVEQRRRLALAAVRAHDAVPDEPGDGLAQRAALAAYSHDQAEPDLAITWVIERRWIRMAQDYLSSVLALGASAFDLEEDRLPRIAHALIASMEQHPELSPFEDLRAGCAMTEPCVRYFVSRPLNAFFSIARALLRAVELRVDKSPCPTLPDCVVDPLALLLAGRFTLRETNEGFVVVGGGREIGVLTPSDRAPRDWLRKNAERVASVHTHRLLRFLLASAWAQDVVDRAPQPDVVTVDGGWRGVAHALGIHGGKGADETQRAARVLSSLRLHTPLGTEPLLTLTSMRRQASLSPGTSELRNTTTVRLELVGPLRRRYVDALRRKVARNWLVPIPPVLPSLGGTKSQAAESSLHLLVLQALRHRAEAFDGGERTIALDDTTFEALGARVGLGAAASRSALTAWCERGSDPFLELVSAGRYRLTPGYAHVERHLLAAKQMALDARARQRRGRNGARKSKA